MDQVLQFTKKGPGVHEVHKDYLYSRMSIP
jgi:hypothetical protein